MSQELVSVVVPTFNRAYCLSQAVDSALSQTHRDVEVIVVDDASRDATPELMRERYGNEPRVRYYRLPSNGGVARARNTALEKATGDFIAFLDSDDVWKPWKLE